MEVTVRISDCFFLCVLKTNSYVSINNEDFKEGVCIYAFAKICI